MRAFATSGRAWWRSAWPQLARHRIAGFAPSAIASGSALAPRATRSDTASPMRWRHAWTIGARGVNVGAHFDPHTRSILLGAAFEVDGVFPKLGWAHRVDPLTGKVHASVATRFHDVLAWGECLEPNRILSASEKRLWLHDAETLTVLLKCEARVPRFARAVCGIESPVGQQWVASATDHNSVAAAAVDSQ